MEELISLSIRIDEEMLKKVHSLAKYEGRSANKEIIYLINKALNEFEKDNEK